MAKITLLFVDDEPHVLEGLRRMLREMRREWDMDFTGSGEDALSLMEKKKYDVIISDVRMPGMDGAQLLEKVKHRHPLTVRIILSGHADRESVFKTVQVAHRYLAKPCDSEKIISAIKQTCILRNLLPDEQIRSFLTRIESLPSLPDIYIKLIEALDDPDISIKKVGSIISRDLGMTAKLLKMVNSAFFGIGRHVMDPAYAVQLLGLESIRSLVLTIQIYTLFEDARNSSLDLEQLLDHSMNVADLAKAIIRSLNDSEVMAEEAFFTGMLHDTGKLLLARYATEQYRQVIVRVRDEQCSCETAEQDMFNISHSEAGAFLLCLWGLPGDLVKGVAHHHDPLMSQDPHSLPLMAVTFSNAIIGMTNGRKSGENVYSENLMEYARMMKIDGKLKSWEELARMNIYKRST